MYAQACHHNNNLIFHLSDICHNLLQTPCEVVMIVAIKAP